jgi:hypothetical protein
VARRRGQGKAVKWLWGHIDYNGLDCLIWPFARFHTGYGNFGHLGKHYSAHRFMCALVHGPAPSALHVAAHSCGRGQHGCVHPRHVSWKTRSENELDKREHGTSKWRESARNGKRYKLTREQVLEIRELEGKRSAAELEKQFGVTRSNIRSIWKRESWATLRRG